MIKSLAKHDDLITSELLFIPDNIRMVQFLHDADLLVDVFLQERFLLQMRLTDDLDCVQFVFFCVNKDVLLRASTTSPNAPLPIDFMIS